VVAERDPTPLRAADLLVLHDPIALSDDPEHGAGVLADGRVEAGDLLAPRLPPVTHGRGIAAVDRDRLALDLPAQARSLDRLRDRRRRLV